MIEKILHRKGHDFKYSINGDKLKELGFEKTPTDLKSEIVKLADWYRRNENWWRTLKWTKKELFSVEDI